MLVLYQAMADRLDLGPGSKVLDVGCGRGRVAHHMASYSGAHVTGINIDHSQVKMAKESLARKVEDDVYFCLVLVLLKMKLLFVFNLGVFCFWGVWGWFWGMPMPPPFVAPPFDVRHLWLRHANVTSMGEQLHFLQGNYNDPLPFADETFDALYQVQVLTYTIDPEKLFKVRRCVGVFFEEMEVSKKKLQISL